MISREEAIEALKTIKEYCHQYVHTQEKTCESCPIGDWCWYDREHLTPDDWHLPEPYKEGEK